MAQKEPGQDHPSLELPSFGLGRRRRRTPEPGSRHPEPGPVDTEPAEPEPVATEPEPTPSGQPLFVEETAEPGERATRRSRWPRIGGLPASVITGAVIGVLAVGLTWAALRLCEFVQGTSSCGNPGFFLLLAIVIVMVLLGQLLLKAFGVDDPGSTSFLGVGLVVVIALLFLIELLFHWWMILVIPAVAMASYALAHWVTTRFSGPVPDDSMHR